jgi:hypothetical protein
MITANRKNQIYVWLVIAAGLAVTAYSGAHLTREQLDVRFLFIAIATILIGPRLSIPIPRVKAHISVSDTFVFLTILLFGGEVAILLATAEAACASLSGKTGPIYSTPVLWRPRLSSQSEHPSSFVSVADSGLLFAELHCPPLHNGCGQYLGTR